MQAIESFLAIGKVSLWGIELVNTSFLTALLLRLFLDGAIIFVVLKQVYYNKRRSGCSSKAPIDYLFTFVVINILVFFVASLLADTKLEMGLAFGLFAIFSILRYRTEPMEIREMTFLFVSIIIAIINSLVTRKVGIVEVLTADICIIGVTWLLECQRTRHKSRAISIKYEKIDMLALEHRDDLLIDLSKRTGEKITHVEIVGMNYLTDSADIMAFCED